MRLRFTKMHGLGNDFVMLDGVSQKLKINSDKIRFLADRNFGIGCDQILIVEPPRSAEADFCYRIFNQDGNEVENCGNGARCFALFVLDRELTKKKTIKVETQAGLLTLIVEADNQVTVDMGPPELSPEKIPFTAKQQSLSYPIQVANKVMDISAVSMGNPHAVMLVDNVEKANVEKLGPLIESHETFPNKVNAGFLEINSRKSGKLRVFERGVGETLACGTGACAAMVSAKLLNLFDSTATLSLPGGDLTINWEGGNNPVKMTGPATIVFHGQIKL